METRPSTLDEINKVGCFVGCTCFDGQMLTGYVAAERVGGQQYWADFAPTGSTARVARGILCSRLIY